MEAPSSLDRFTGQYLIRFETELEPLSLLNWLKNQECRTKIYWACRQGNLEIAAVGLADSIDATNTSSLAQAMSTIETRLRNSSPQVRYYGGQCFDPENVDSADWSGFGQYRFVVPQYELIRKDNTYTLVHNVLADSKIDTEKIRRQSQEFMKQGLLDLDFSKETVAEQKTVSGVSRKDVPSRSEWISQAAQLIQLIRSGHMEKVVLAHKADLISNSVFNPVTLLERIKSRSCQTYTFLYQFPESRVFLGASPECLFKKDDMNIYSEAIAGTQAATADHAENIQLQDALRQSAKEQQEHDYVADNIQAALQSICENVSCTESREILQMTSIQHLYTRFQGQLKENVNIFHILNALHPTAAVNGTPSREATGHIRKLEPFSRGWYAGAIGWITSEQAEFAVAIRSALVHKQTISLYSGAGIVKDSDPEQEWEETELKKRLILEAVKEII